MATQQRVLEVLRQRVASGELPVVSVGGVDYEFVGVGFGGASPSVLMRGPDGEKVSRTAAAWTKLGAVFKARSRNLLRATRGSVVVAKKTSGQLDREIAVIAAAVAKPEVGYTTKQRAAQAEIKLDAIPGSEWSRARVVSVLNEVDTEALRQIEWSHLVGGRIFAAGRQVAEWAHEILRDRESGR